MPPYAVAATAPIAVPRRLRRVVDVIVRRERQRESGPECTFWNFVRKIKKIELESGDDSREDILVFY